MKYDILVTRKDFKMKTGGLLIKGDTQEIIADDYNSVIDYMTRILAFDDSLKEVIITPMEGK